MLDIFGIDLGMGYDIGCRVKTTVNNSPLGEKARKNNHQCLVGAFHGHAHNRLCQSEYLTTYVEGLGLEDLEGCERFFSKSNALAASTRYASTFHRRQAISEYATYTGKFETYPNLSELSFYLIHVVTRFLKVKRRQISFQQLQAGSRTSRWCTISCSSIGAAWCHPCWCCRRMVKGGAGVPAGIEKGASRRDS